MLSNAQIQSLLIHVEATTTLFDTPFPSPTLLHLGLTLCRNDLPPTTCRAEHPATPAKQQTGIHCRAALEHRPCTTLALELGTVRTGTRA
jgi:hypothetical protein